MSPDHTPPAYGSSPGAPPGRPADTAAAAAAPPEPASSDTSPDPGPGHWRIAVDTGGTFTDCIALDPRGGLHRAKVLSTSALRGIAEPIATTADGSAAARFRVSGPWDPLPDRFLRGMTFAPLIAGVGQPPTGAVIVEHDASTGVIDLAAPLAIATATPPPATTPTQAGRLPSFPFEARSTEEAPVLAARLVTRTPGDARLPDGLSLRLATTRGTNALLERRGARVAFFVTRGFRDLLVIGNQQRPDLFALNIIKPQPLYDRVIEVPERIDSTGRVIEPLDHDAIADAVQAAIRDGIRVAAIALVNAYLNPTHEQVLGRILLGRGFEFIAASAELAPRVRLLPRAQTAVVDAYLTPVLHSYVHNIEACVNARSAARDRPGSPDVLDAADRGRDGAVAASISSDSRMPAPSRLHLMTSAGGLVSAAQFRPKDSLLSGPAGGVAGAAAAGRRSGYTRIIGFDMGGTSTDVSRYDAAFEYQFEHSVGDAHLLAPALAIETVAAGGGSIAWFDGHRLRVGPQSAGAQPGPACYGAGGPLTLTDVNLLLGRLSPANFALPVNVTAAIDALADLMSAVQEGRPCNQPEEPGAGGAGLIQSEVAAPPIDRASMRRRLLKSPGFAERARTMLHGLLDIANERMAEAIRRISVRKGDDPARYALVAFGGAGGQHACAVADRLNMRTVIVPADAGLLSAVGLQHAVIERFAEHQVLRPLRALLDDAPDDLSRLVTQLETQAREAVAAETAADAGADVPIIIRRRIASLRLRGQESTLDCDFADPRDLPRFFEDAYRRLYGHSPSRAIVPELESLRVVACTVPSTSLHAIAAVDTKIADGPPSKPAGSAGEGPRQGGPASPAALRVVGAPLDPMVEQIAGATPDIVHRSAFRIEHGRLPGPALIAEAHALTVVPTGWTARTDAAGAIILEKASEPSAGRADINSTAETASKGDEVAAIAAGRGVVPITGGSAAHKAEHAIALELFTNRFRTIAEQTGEVLRRTALSTNVKERLDFSCALLDADGQLVVNAPHIPVHLGALGVCVRRVMRHLPNIGPGDVIVTNHPGFGGSHLPDVTIITPVFMDTARSAAAGTHDLTSTAGARTSPLPPQLLGFIASRAHHAEIGGRTPGSMPPHATQLVEEGVVIAPRHLIQAGQPNWNDLRRLLLDAPWPTRLVEENIADMQAAVAANHQGALALADLAVEHGPGTVRQFMDRLRQQSAQRVREALRALPDGVLKAEEFLDDGSPIRVRIDIRDDEATIDFTGTAPVHPGNLNCTEAVVRSAVMYVLRLLINQPLPLNEGLLEPVRLVVPVGTMLNPIFDVDDPTRCPAVVGGNVETSQRVVDTVLKALGIVACSQGTMNNVVFGNDRFGYYETICGGAGAGPGFAGADAVHTHMTNTRITDVEVIEHRYPVRIDRFEIRLGSGGIGTWNGGNGVRREFTFLEPVQLSIVSQHRQVQPYGAAGGWHGTAGRQHLVRPNLGPHDTSTIASEMAGVDHAHLNAGDQFIIETPGGGGWGTPTTSSA